MQCFSNGFDHRTFTKHLAGPCIPRHKFWEHSVPITLLPTLCAPHLDPYKCLDILVSGGGTVASLEHWSGWGR